MLNKFEHKRLFVPLASTPFNWFIAGKKWEVRNVKGQYNKNNIFIRKDVELRKGYNTSQSILGIIEEVQLFENSNQLLFSIPYKEIIPIAKSKDEALLAIEKYTKESLGIIAFKVRIINLKNVHKNDDDVRRIKVKKVKLLDSFYSLVEKGLKRSTIRNGYVFPETDNIELVFDNHNSIKMDIDRIDYSKTFNSLNDHDAIKDGFVNSFELKQAIKKFYPNIKDENPVSIIYFRSPSVRKP